MTPTAPHSKALVIKPVGRWPREFHEIGVTTIYIPKWIYTIYYITYIVHIIKDKIYISLFDLHTYLRSPLRAWSHIIPTPRNAFGVCLLPALQYGPTPPRRASISRSTDLPRVSFSRSFLLFTAGVHRMATLGIDVGGILLTCPIHSIFITSTEMGSKHPSSLVELRIEYFSWPKDVLNSSNTLVLEHF